MGPIHLFNVASRANHWLSVRQSTIAENVANANTPGFKAQDVKPFGSVLDSMAGAMATTSPQHLSFAPAGSARAESTQVEGSEVLHSGNTVSLEKEMAKAGEVNRAFALNTNIVKAFHRMLMASTKG
ncbi:MAG: flagellar basal body rod protein FlgB [Hyphomicrobiaceae bacterium]